MTGKSSLTRQERYDEYVELGLSMKDIARREKISYASLLKWLGREEEGA